MCMYVCMYICMHVCMHVCMYVCMYVWDVCMIVASNTGTFLRICTQRCNVCIHMHTSIGMQMQTKIELPFGLIFSMYIPTMYVCIRMHTYICMQTQKNAAIFADFWHVHPWTPSKKSNKNNILSRLWITAHDSWGCIHSNKRDDITAILPVVLLKMLFLLLFSSFPPVDHGARAVFIQINNIIASLSWCIHVCMYNIHAQSSESRLTLYLFK